MKNYKKAEQQLQLALKLEPENVEILNEMGDVLYKQNKYKDSLVYLNRSLLIEPSFAETKFFIGASYLKINYYEDAQRIFADLVNQNPRSFEANFNLGESYKGMKESLLAVIAFRTATEIKPNDADAHYEYAISLNKAGSQADVMKEYFKLREIDAKMAEKLRKALGLKNVPKNANKVNDVYGEGLGSGYGNGSGKESGTTYP